jgi:hypothetical protein
VSPKCASLQGTHLGSHQSADDDIELF